LPVATAFISLIHSNRTINFLQPSNANSVTDDNELIDLGELLRTLSHYKWSIVSIVVLTVICTAFYGFSLDRYYRATTTIMIETNVKGSPVAGGEGANDTSFDQMAYFSTQVAILQSRDLIFHVVDRLNLVAKTEFEQKLQSIGDEKMDWRNSLPFVDKPRAKPLSVEKIKALKREEVADEVLSQLTVKSRPGTFLIEINYDAKTPELSAEVSNAIADVFIESGLQARLDSAQKASGWLTEKLGDIRGQLEASEKRLQDYRERQQLLNVGGARTLDEDQLLDTTRRLREAERKRTELASAYNKIQQAGNKPEQLREISILLSDERVGSASQAFQAAQEAFRQLSERYGEKHPSMPVARARFESARSAYYDALRVAAQGIKAQYEIAADTERALSNVVAGSRQQIRRLDEKQYDLNVLERDVTSNRELYNMFLTRFKETDSVNSFQTMTARVVDSALVPREPFEPNLSRLMLVGMAVGLVLALVLTTLRHILSEYVRSAEEMEALTQAPVLGALPMVEREDRAKVALLFQQKPKSIFSEGIRSIRTALRLSDVDKKYRRILVTSSLPAEGKSSVSCALALSFAASEQTLLVDTDLRKPSVGRSFQLSANFPGLSELLAGQVKLEDCLYLHQPSGLYVLPAGRHSPNPAEFIASQAFKGLMDSMAQRFQRIILDSPPCHAAADSLQLSQLCDGVIFVVKSESTSRRIIRNSFKLLRNVGAPLIGTIVNQIEGNRAGLDYHGYYTYGYYGSQEK
jgi:capsular exopolysaccharide synthesis family protein